MAQVLLQQRIRFRRDGRYRMADLRPLPGRRLQVLDEDGVLLQVPVEVPVASLDHHHFGQQGRDDGLHHAGLLPPSGQVGEEAEDIQRALDHPGVRLQSGREDGPAGTVHLGRVVGDVGKNLLLLQWGQVEGNLNQFVQVVPALEGGVRFGAILALDHPLNHLPVGGDDEDASGYIQVQFDRLQDLHRARRETAVQVVYEEHQQAVAGPDVLVDQVGEPGLELLQERQAAAVDFHPFPPERLDQVLHHGDVALGQFDQFGQSARSGDEGEAQFESGAARGGPVHLQGTQFGPLHVGVKAHPPVLYLTGVLFGEVVAAQALQDVQEEGPPESRLVPLVLPGIEPDGTGAPMAGGPLTHQPFRDQPHQAGLPAPPRPEDAQGDGGVGGEDDVGQNVGVVGEVQPVLTAGLNGTVSPERSRCVHPPPLTIDHGP